MKVVLGGTVRLARSLPGDVRWCEAKTSRRSRPLNRGISAHCDKTDPISLYESGLREKGISGYLYIVAHASPTSIQGISISAVSRLAALIGRSHIWNGEPILIDACNAGAQADGIASKLAATLSTYVTAPTRWTWTYPQGGSAVGQGAYDKLPGILSGLPIPNLLRPGTWRTWGPDGAMTGETGTSPRDTGTVLSPAAARALAAKPTGR